MAERILIEVTEKGAKVVSRKIKDIGTSAQNTSKVLGGLKTLLATYITAQTIKQLVNYADTWTLISSRVSLTTKSITESIAVQNTLFEVTQRTRSELQPTVQLYSRLALTSKSLGATQGQLVRVTETLNKATKISGATTAEASGALIQLAQGLGAGVLRGQELNSVLEQTPRIAQLIAKQLGVTVGELKGLGEAGAITSKQVFNALLSGSKEIDKEFSKLQKTTADAFTQLTNSFIKFIGEANQSLKITDKLIVAIDFLGENLKTLSQIIGTLILTKFAFTILGWVSALKTAIVAIGGFAGVLKILPALIAKAFAVAVIPALIFGLIKLYENSELFRKSLADTVKIIKTSVIPAFESLGKAIDIDFTNFDIDVAVAALQVALVTLIETFRLLGKTVIDIFDLISLPLQKLGEAIGKTIAIIQSNLKDLSIVDIIRGRFDAEKLTKELQEAFSSSFANIRKEGEETFLEIGKNVDDIFKTPARVQESVFANLDKIKEEAQNRLKKEPLTVPFDLSLITLTPAEIQKKLQKEANKLRGLDLLQDVEVPIRTKLLLNKDQIEAFKRVQAGLVNVDPIQIKTEIVPPDLTKFEQILDAIFSILPTFDEFENVFGSVFRGLDAFAEQTGNIWKNIELVTVRALNSITDEIVNFVQTGSFNFKNFANSVVTDLLRIFTKLLLIQGLESVLGVSSGGQGLSGLIGNLFSGRQFGGPVTAGNPFVVGERGPELFVPQTSGRIETTQATQNLTSTQQQPVNIINIVDPNTIGQYLQSQEGEQTILNIISDNPDAIRQATQ